MKVKLMDIPELKNFVNFQLLNNPPILGVARKLPKNTYVSFQTTDHIKIGKYMRTDEKISPIFSKAAEDMKNNPTATFSDASLFGGKANICIGRTLALKEFYIVHEKVLAQFTISTNETEFTYITKITKQANPFMVKVKSKSA